ncbi:MAG: hypothetical protein LBU26_05690 [Synergistaceae bacterium]|jgi:hypothetical protein|nr:hypothetical protein [Synergistaceae bacterium]
MKYFRKIFCASAIIAALASAQPSRAAEPTDALTARGGAGSVYMTARLSNLNAVMKAVFTRQNVDAFMAAFANDAPEGVEMIASIASQIPAESVGVSAGMDPEGFFFQLAAALPAEYAESVAAIASGAAKPQDMASVLLGPMGALLGEMLEPQLRQGDGGSPYYEIFGGKLVAAAKDGLVLLAASPKDLAASLASLGGAAPRLAVERRFGSGDYIFSHTDMPAYGGDAAAQYKAPLEAELDFERKPGSFLVSGWVNLPESLAAAQNLPAMEAKKGADAFLAGGGNALLVLAGPMILNSAYIRSIPSAVKGWEEAVAALGGIGISEADFDALCSGMMSIAAGNSATLAGPQNIPGAYVALRGKDGAAAKIMGALAGNEDLKAHLPLEPVSAEGWDMLCSLPALPATVLAGVKGETLFLGLADAQTINEAPALSAKARGVLEENYPAGGFIDTEALWNRLRNEAANPGPLAAAYMEAYPEAAEAVRNVLGAELAVNFIKITSESWEKGAIEFFLADVPPEKALTPRVLNAISVFSAKKTEEEGTPAEPGGAASGDGAQVQTIETTAVEGSGE